MEHTAYLDFEQEEQPVDVYSVDLASENPSDNYGILDVSDQTTTVAYGTSVVPLQLGQYSYTFPVQNGHIYLISWEITANVGETPTYKTEQVGPFFSVNNSDIRANTDTGLAGEFKQGEVGTVLLKITNFDGTAVNAEDMSIAIYDANGVEVILTNTTPQHIETGFYGYDWDIDDDQTVGEYTVVWSYVADDIEKAEIQNVVITEDATDTIWYSGRALAFRRGVEHLLACTQHIPIYYEQAKPSRDNKVFRFSFPRWNQSTDIKIYKNENIVNSGLEIDYFNGTATFDDTLLPQETVFADYNFKWFSDAQLNQFIVNSLQHVNLFPPASSYNLDTVPNRFAPVIMYGAVKDALRQLMLCIQFQQPAQVFGGIEQARAAFNNFETLKQNYEKDWEKLLEQKKFGPYPKTRLVVTPEYTLPGGRSRWFRYLFKG